MNDISKGIVLLIIKTAGTLHLQWSISDQSKQHVLVFNELLSAVNRPIHELLVTTEDVHYTVNHA